MSTIPSLSSPVKSRLVSPGRLAIGDTFYRLGEIDPGECGVKAFRLEKCGSNDAYDLVVTEHSIDCDCADFTFRSDGPGYLCKHGAAALDLGLATIPKPVAYHCATCDHAHKPTAGFALADGCPACHGALTTVLDPDPDPSPCPLCRNLGFISAEFHHPGGPVSVHCPDCGPDITLESPYDAPSDFTPLMTVVMEQASYFRSWATDNGNLIAETLERLAHQVECVGGESVTADEFRAARSERGFAEKYAAFLEAEVGF